MEVLDWVGIGISEKSTTWETAENWQNMLWLLMVAQTGSEWKTLTASYERARHVSPTLINMDWIRNTEKQEVQSQDNKVSYVLLHFKNDNISRPWIKARRWWNFCCSAHPMCISWHWRFHKPHLLVSGYSYSYIVTENVSVVDIFCGSRGHFQYSFLSNLSPYVISGAPHSICFQYIHKLYEATACWLHMFWDVNIMQMCQLGGGQYQGLG